MNAFLLNAPCLRTNSSPIVLFPSFWLSQRSIARASWQAVGHASRTTSLTAYSVLTSHRGLRNARQYSSHRVPQVKAFGFRELDIREPIVDAAKKAFPDIQRPTLAQAEFIPAILGGHDVLLHDETGTGKSFGIILALLSKQRARPSRAVKGPVKSCITSLVLVPHRDLGFQMIHWIEAIISNSGQAQPSLDAITQLVVRGEDASIEEQIQKLHASPPHILLGTPQALLEIYRKDKRALQIDDLATLVVDEVDYLLDVPPPYQRKLKVTSAWRNFRRHPSAARQLLEEVLPRRKPGAIPLSDIRFDDDESPAISTRRVSPVTTMPGSQPLQVIMSSATVHSALRKFIYEAQWLGGNRIVISGKEAAKKNAHMVFESDEILPEVVHHAFVVSRDGQLSNVKFALRPDQQDRDRDVPDSEDDRPSGYSGASTKRKSVSPPRSPLAPEVMEAVATFFAYDVPTLALLVLPPSASVRDAVVELQNLGVNAHGLDLRVSGVGQEKGGQAGEPTLLVATPSSTRGVDLPRLTHVFVVGAPDTGNVDVFRHIAGRVDRFGSGGKVVTFLTEPEQEHRDGMMRTTRNPEGLLRVFYRSLGIKPVWFNLSALDMTFE